MKNLQTYEKRKRDLHLETVSSYLLSRGKTGCIYLFDNVYDQKLIKNAENITEFSYNKKLDSTFGILYVNSRYRVANNGYSEYPTNNSIYPLADNSIVELYLLFDNDWYDLAYMECSHSFVKANKDKACFFGNKIYSGEYFDKYSETIYQMLV